MPNPKNNQIDYIEFQATDLEGTRGFFEELFGWSFTEFGPDYISFNDGRLDGGFYRAQKRARVADGSVLIVFYHDDLAALVGRVGAAGGTVTQDIYSFPGGKRFHFTCPSGNEYAIWSEA